jgi:hypothetical protein
MKIHFVFILTASYDFTMHLIRFLHVIPLKIWKSEKSYILEALFIFIFVKCTTSIKTSEHAKYIIRKKTTQ